MKYTGFYIEKAFGNNAFSYDKRDNKKIYIPQIIDVKFEDINNNFKQSGKIAFSELDEYGIEKNIYGLENFLHIQKDNKDIYIFDNHNHAFYFIARNIVKENISDISEKFIKEKMIDEVFNMDLDNLNSYYNENIDNKNIYSLILKINNFLREKSKKTMIHFDQHKDMRVPRLKLSEFAEYIDSNKSEFIKFLEKEKFINLFKNKSSDFFEKEFFENNFLEIRKNIEYSIDNLLFLYTNYHLNVGNFIVPLRYNNFINDVIIVDSTYSLGNLNMDNYEDVILDIDLDFFSTEMDYIDNDIKLNKIADCYEKASIITICTSPYFIEFDRAKKYLKLILDRF